MFLLFNTLLLYSSGMQALEYIVVTIGNFVFGTYGVFYEDSSIVCIVKYVPVAIFDIELR